MDTVVEHPATDGTPDSVATLRATGRDEWSAEELRQARIALGEYARKVGIYEPIDVVTFTQMCLREATRRLDGKTVPNNNVLITEALCIASASCGLRVPNRGESMESQESRTESTEVTAANKDDAAVRSFVAIVAEKPVAAVPESHKRVMPLQPLGELPDIRPTTIWSSCAQAMRRAASTVVASVFARTD